MIYQATALAIFCLMYTTVEGEVVQRAAAECKLPSSRGPCIQNIVRFYYDSTSGKCKTFLYGGCQGNLNNFKTLDECNGRCICSQTPATGNGTKTQERYYYDVSAERCKPFVYSGEGGNQNRFRSRSNCKTKCLKTPVRENCDVRPDRGVSCSTPGSRQYYFDQNCNCCRSFRYLGCGGNNNRFPSFKECISTCRIEKPLKPEVRPVQCTLQPVYGNCTSELIRYYYNAVTDSCLPFVYSGCGGTANNFETLTQCNDKCIDFVSASESSALLQTKETRNETIPESDTMGNVGELLGLAGALDNWALV